MTKAIPAVLLALLLISPVYAVDPDPYEGLCTSKQDFNSTATASFICRGTNAQACNDAGGEFHADDGICEGLELSPDKCEYLDGFTYMPDLTCEVAGRLLSDPILIEDACSDMSFFMIVSQAQFNCCGGAENHKDICPVLPKPHEAICTSELDFQTMATATYDCKGTNAEACTDAGGEFNEDDGRCEGFELRYRCEDLPGFNSEPNETCEDMGNDLLEESNIDERCNDPADRMILALAQSNCCGGAENHKDICPDNPEPYEGFCTSKLDFQTYATATYDCIGTNAETCTDAGGEFHADDDRCEGFELPDKCADLPGFNSVPHESCAEVGFVLLDPDIIEDVCSNPAYRMILALAQSNCCGGEDNHKVVCPEPICTDSTAKIFQRNEEAIGCDSLTKCDAKTKTHCPLKCGLCDTHACKDSLATFEFENNGQTKKMNCVFNGVSIHRATRMCMHSQIKTSCRRTCGLCYDPDESPHPHGFRITPLDP